MNKILSAICMLLITASSESLAQAWEWAYTAGSTPRSQAVTVKEDLQGNFYVASYTDSVTTRLYTTMEKHDMNQQVMWQKQITGTATITDLEINAADHVVVVGYFTGAIDIDGNTLTSFSPSDNSAFIFEADASGTIQWAHDLNPVNGDFKTGDLFIAADGNMYLTSEVSGIFGSSAFHKLNAQGTILKNEFNNNFENRTFSHVLADSSGNVYLSGTCGNGATFDTINANPNFSYQNFLVGYDSTFKAQWFLSRNYITFDNNNGLGTDGQNLYWAFDDFSSNADTARIIKCDVNGQVLADIAGPLAISFFPSIAYNVDRFGNSVLVLNTFTRFYMYRYDAAFNITWVDTIYTGTSGFPLQAGLTCYDSSFYLTSFYMNDTLLFDNMMLLNPNTGANYPSDLFVAKWSILSPSAITAIEAENNELLLFPDPASEFAVVSWKPAAGSSVNEITITVNDLSGKIFYTKKLPVSGSGFQTSIEVTHFAAGIYLLNVTGTNKEVNSTGKLVVMH